MGLKNGVFDLQAGKFRDARRDDLITKQAGCELDENAKCHEWEKFISEISRGDIELAAYLRRMFGYCLTGGTAEQCFFVLHGSGANGKSVFLNTLEALLGDYAKRTPPETLLSQRATGGARPDLARLAGVRAALAAESGATALLDEPVVKQLTGQDTVTARYLYSDLFEFKPQFKLILATNYVPEIRGTDQGIWRRIHLVPFNAYFTTEKQNLNLERELKAELPGILNWALKGLRDYRDQIDAARCAERAHYRS